MGRCRPRRLVRFLPLLISLRRRLLARRVVVVGTMVVVTMVEATMVEATMVEATMVEAAMVEAIPVRIAAAMAAKEATAATVETPAATAVQASRH